MIRLESDENPHERRIFSWPILYVQLIAKLGIGQPGLNAVGPVTVEPRQEPEGLSNTQSMEERPVPI